MIKKIKEDLETREDGIFNKILQEYANNNKKMN